MGFLVEGHPELRGQRQYEFGWLGEQKCVREPPGHDQAATRDVQTEAEAG